MAVRWFLGLTHEASYEVFSEPMDLDRIYSARLKGAQGHSRRRCYQKIWGPFRSVAAAWAAQEHPRRRETRETFTENPPEAVEIYDRVLAIEARKGRQSLWPNEQFRHDFRSGNAKVYGLQDGSILIKGRKPLWKRFRYDRDDSEE